MRYANGGLAPAQLVRRARRSCASVDLPGFPLGLRPDAEYAATDLELEDGDSLLLSTDGVADLRNSKGSVFGEREFGAVLGEASRKASDLGALLEERLCGFADADVWADDATFVVVTARARQGDAGGP